MNSTAAVIPHVLESITFLAHVPAVAGQAQADERVDFINAGAAVLTRVGQAVVDIYERTQVSRVSVWPLIS